MNGPSGRTSTVEIDRGRVGAAQQHCDALGFRRAVAAGEQRGECRGAAGLSRDAQNVPQPALCVVDRRVLDQHRRCHMALRDREHQRADPARSQRLGGDPTSGRIDGVAGLKGVVQRRRQLRFDRDDLNPAGIPRGDAADQPAASGRDQQRVDLRAIDLKLQPDRALPEQRLALVVGVHRQPPVSAARASLAASASA